MSDWFVLRTAGRSTLRLAASLAEDGFETWVPVEVTIEHEPKLNLKREVRRPILPSYVFVGIANKKHPVELIDLMRMAELPVKPRRGWKNGYRRDAVSGELPPHTDFRVYRRGERIFIIEDRHLNPLRRIARRRTAAPITAPLKPYQTVRASEGAGSFHGMVGKVQVSNERETIVCFGGGLLERVKIPTSFLLLEQVYELQSNTDTAARKAA